MLQPPEVKIKVLVTGGSGFIGSHLVERLLSLGYQVLNLDITPPKVKAQDGCWHYCDILDGEQTRILFQKFDPKYVVHLAALAQMEGESIDDFKVNTEGTNNLLSAIELSGHVEKFVMTSTQHVRSPGSPPTIDSEDFEPYKLYGKSKMIAELAVRHSNSLPHWVIIRPTNIWGPNHPQLTYGLWKLIFTKKYFHPMNDQVVKCYGFVKNTVWQITELLELKAELSNRRTLYLGDGLLRQIDWVNAMSLGLTSERVRVIPKALIHLLSLLGDVIGKLGFSFPIYKDRYLNLITTNLVPVEDALILLGPVPYPFQLGIRETADWLRLEIYNEASNHAG